MNINKKDYNDTYSGLEIAVIGISGRFPGAKNVEEFWRNLKNGKETINFFSNDEMEYSGVNPGLLTKQNYVKAGGILDDIECFDAFFFGYTPKEAEIMNPQIRIFYECVYEALENAGYAPGNYNGLIGIYAGGSIGLGWESLVILSGKVNEDRGQFAAATLTDKDSLSTRISYKLNLKGPAVSLRTACSTSLVAIHTACRALLTKECDIALAGGVTIQNLKKSGYLYREGLIVSPDGHCRPFDAKANGIVFGDGAGVVALKKLKNAISDGDNIYAVIKGSAINNDGSRKVGYTAPSVEGQADVIKMAQKIAGVDPDSIGYLEAHGTGTNIGDPIEIEALTLAFAATKRKNFCALGSVKSNIGHLDAAAGAAGFIKTVLALKYRLIPPNLHFETPNPEIDFENSPFYVNAKLSGWKNDDYPLRAGVSAFGFGGTNAHLILEEAPREDLSAETEKWKLILFSAKTGTALDKMTKNLLLYFKDNPGVNLADAAYTLQVGRQVFPYRRMLVGTSVDEIIHGLSSLDSGKLFSFPGKEGKPLNVFMFPGQGAQYVNMGLELYTREPVFREEMNRCFEILNGLLDYDIKEILYPRDSVREASKVSEECRPVDNRSHITRTEAAQPLLFTIEYALAKLLMKWGIKPDAMIGHSIGEYTAACLSGVFTLENALKLVVSRGKLMQRLPGGAMLGVGLSEKDIKPLLGSNDELSLAAINSTAHCVVSGPKEAVDAFSRQLKEKGHKSRRLHTSHAFHSKMMEPITGPFEKEARQLTFNKPKIPYISNLTGSWVGMNEAVDPRYWAKHLRGSVRFAHGLKELLKEKEIIFIEVGPGRGLSTFVSQHEDKKTGHRVIDLIRHPREQTPDTCYLLNQIGRLWLYGAGINWTGFYEGEARRRISLPTYPFEKKYYWIKGGALHLGPTRLSARLSAAKPAGSADWYYVPSWKRSPLPKSGSRGRVPGKSNWLIFPDTCGIGDQLAGRLTGNGEGVVVVNQAAVFAKTGDSEFTIHPTRENDYQKLADELRHMDRIPDHILDLSNITRHRQIREEIPGEAAAGITPLLYLARVFGKKNLNSGVRVTVFTNGMQEVIGGDLLYPQKKPLIGAVQFIPVEYPGINCRSIDIDIYRALTTAENHLVDNLLEELNQDMPGMDTFVVYRSNSRWVETYERVCPGKPAQAAPLAEENVDTGNLHDTKHFRQALSSHYTPPGTETEKSLALIWQDIFGRTHLGIHDDFFELGGDSLKAMNIISGIHEKLEVEVPLEIFLSQPTINRLARYVLDNPGKSKWVTIEPTEEKEYYALSSAQNRLYVTHLMNLAGTGYNMPIIVSLEGTTNKNRLENTFGKLMKRHEGLRTSFEIVDDIPVQKIHKTVDFELNYFDPDNKDAEGEAGDKWKSEVEKIVRDFIQPFDLSRPPLLRACLIKQGEDKHILMVDIHHIITDGISQSILVQEFMSLHTGEELSPLRLHYRDFSEWKNRLYETGVITRQEKYWINQFKGDIPRLNLPVDFMRPVEKSFKGEVLEFKLGKAEADKLKVLAAQFNTTLYIFLLSIYYVFLSKLSGSAEDIVVGCASEGRRHTDLRQLVGIFINMLPLRNYPSQEKVFEDFLVEVKKRTLEAFENRDYPFERLVEKVGGARDLSRYPLIDVGFTQQNLGIPPGNRNENKPGANRTGLRVVSSNFKFLKKAARIDLNLEVYEIGEQRLLFVFEYAADLFKKKTIQRYAGYYRQILTAVMKNTRVKIKDIPLISEEERKEIHMDIKRSREFIQADFDF